MKHQYQEHFLPFPIASDPKAWDHWPQLQSYVHLTQHDVDQMTAARDVLMQHKQTIITKTVDALFEEPFLRHIADKESTRERLEGVIQYYLESLLSPKIDDDYIATLTRIGRVHVQVHLPPEWVQATCILIIHMIFDTLLPLADPQLVMAFIKRLLFDNIFIVGEYVRGMMDLQHQNEHLTQTNVELSTQVALDSLTQCINHRTSNVRLDQEIGDDQRQNAFAILFLDIDHFKAINDNYGHIHGDQLLIEFSQQVQSVLRSHDILGRWGGEEFIAILPHCEQDQTIAIGERIREHISQHLFKVGGGIHVTCSIGGACYPQDADNRDMLVQSADRAMYLAKHLGRNQMRMVRDITATIIPLTGAQTSSRDDTLLTAIVETLVESLAAHDSYTGYHVKSVGFLARQLARHLACSEEEIKMIGLAGDLHDLGKLAIPTAILTKATSLTPAEWKKIRTHPVVGAELIQKIPLLRPIVPFVRGHHERWDGTGYPDRLQAEQIPLGARIIAVVDALDAMTTDRSYRSAHSIDWAIAELRQSAGTQFDPHIVEVFCQMYHQERAA
jgi:diguanylate cyclase (GGDEF)-like protein